MDALTASLTIAGLPRGIDRKCDQRCASRERFYCERIGRILLVFWQHAKTKQQELNATFCTFLSLIADLPLAQQETGASNGRNGVPGLPGLTSDIVET